MLRIAIADDEELVLESIKERVLSSNLDVGIVGFARNGAEAFEFLKKKKPDVFLVDINMPTIDGIAFIQEVREQFPEIHTKFVVISGYDDFTYLQRAIQLGVSDYIRKPVVQDELVQILSKLEKQARKEKSSLLKYNCQFYHEFREKLDDLSEGTLLICYGKKVLSYTDQIFLEAQILFRLTDKPEETSVKMLVWPEVDNVVGIFLDNVRLEQEKLIRFTEEAQVRLPLKYFYSYTTGAGIDEAVRVIEEEMNQRFLDESIRYLECTPKKKMNNLNFKDFEISVTHTSLAEALKNSKELIEFCFGSRENMVLLVQCFRQISVILINLLLKNGIPIPESLRRNLTRFSLSRFNDKEDILGGVEEQITFGVGQAGQAAMKSELIESVLQYLQEHYQENITLNSLSEYFFVTPTYLSKKFKEKSNITLSQYLENVRIDAAKRMLRMSELSVSDIAIEVGYPDSNYFSRVFKKATALTPSDYRNLGELH